jgi:hypothetical protein
VVFPSPFRQIHYLRHRKLNDSWKKSGHGEKRNYLFLLEFEQGFSSQRSATISY